MRDGTTGSNKSHNFRIHARQIQCVWRWMDRTSRVQCRQYKAIEWLNTGADATHASIPFNFNGESRAPFNCGKKKTRTHFDAHSSTQPINVFLSHGRFLLLSIAFEWNAMKRIYHCLNWAALLMSGKFQVHDCKHIHSQDDTPQIILFRHLSTQYSLEWSNKCCDCTSGIATDRICGRTREE